MNNQVCVVIANEEKRVRELRLKTKYVPKKHLNYVGRKCDCVCSVVYNVDDASCEESYEVYEYTKSTNKLLIKHKIESYDYEFVENEVVFTDKETFEFLLVKKPDNFDEKNNFVLNDKNCFSHKRLNKQHKLVDSNHVFEKSHYFVTSATLVANV